MNVLPAEGSLGSKVHLILVTPIVLVALIAASSLSAAQPKHSGSVTARVTREPGKPHHPVGYKTASWPDEFRVGDCGQKPATLRIGSDGTLHYEGVTYTYHTHGKDVWHVAFHLLDKDGVTVGSMPYHDGPGMDDGNGGPPPKYRWTADGQFDPANFNAVASVTEYAKC